MLGSNFDHCTLTNHEAIIKQHTTLRLCRSGDACATCETWTLALTVDEGV